MALNSNVQSNCETVVMFTGGGPTTAGAAVIVNGVQLIPSPFLNITIEKYKANNTIIGGVMKVQLNGTAVGNSFDEVAAGTGPATSIKDILDLAKISECVPLVIQCGATFIKGKGRIISANANEGKQPTWVNLASYSLEIELYENDGKPVVDVDKTNTSQYAGIDKTSLQSLSEQFTLSIHEDSINWDMVRGTQPQDCPTSDTIDNYRVGNKHVKVTFSIGSTGLSGGCETEDEDGKKSDTKYGLEAAEIAIFSRIEKLKKMDLDGIPNAPPNLKDIFHEYAGGESFLDFRTVEVNPVENSISINGEIIYRPSGCYHNNNIFTTLNVEESVDNDGRTVTISGTAKGLEDINYVKAIRSLAFFNNCREQNRMARARRFIEDFNDEDLLKRIAQAHFTRNVIVDSCSTSQSANNPCPSLSPYPSQSPAADLCDMRLISSQIGNSYGQGETNFTFVLSNKNNCSIYGARKVDVEITDDFPRDNIVEILIPGRGDKGVLIQNLCCNSARKRSITINASLTNNLCGYKKDDIKISQLKACAKDLLRKLEEESDVDVSCWFVTENQESLGNNTYRLSKQYVEPSCP